MTRVYEEIVDFIAAGVTAEEIAAFRPSENVKARVAELIAREKAGTRTAEDAEELEHFLQLEHVMRLAKQGRGGMRSTSSRPANFGLVRECRAA